MVRQPRPYARSPVALALLLAGAMSAQAQTPPTTSPADLQASLEAAQAAAVRPGDESLGCDALQRELVGNARSEPVQSYVARSGAAAQSQLDAVKSAQSKVAAQAALTVFSSVVPGGAWAQQGAAAAQAPLQQAQAAQTLQQRMQQAQEMVAMLPVMMRSQRVIELAQARRCDWLSR